MVEIGDLSENMKVRARDGEELGTIIRLEGESILMEKGLSSFEDYRIPTALVTDVRDGVAWLSVTREELHRRTLREETSAFVHEGEDVGVAGGRMPDNLREGETAETSGPER